jgi:sugar lactone lactonase YvrE
MKIVVFFFGVLFFLSGCTEKGFENFRGSASAPKVLLGTAPGDGVSAAAVRFNYPHDAVEGPDGAIYVTETSSHVIRKIINNRVEVFAGNFLAGFNGDGKRDSISLKNPSVLSLQGDELFFSDTGNFLIRKINLKTGLVSTVSGIAGKKDWPTPSLEAGKSAIGYTYWIGHDVNGNLWAAMRSGANNEPPRLYRVSRDYGSWEEYPLPKGIPADDIKSVRLMPNGDVDLFLYNKFYRLTSKNKINYDLRSLYGGGIYFDDEKRETYIGDHTRIIVLDEAGLLVRALPIEFANTVSIREMGDSSLLVVDSDLGRVFRISKQGEILWSTGDNSSSVGVVVSLAGTSKGILALDNIKPAIIGLDSRGGVDKIAGSGKLEWASININGLQTGFYYPGSVAIDSLGNLYIAEQHRIMRVDAKSRDVSLYCGYETAGNVYNVNCGAARFNSIRGLSFDSKDDLYVADTYNNQIKKVEKNGKKVSLVAGVGKGRTFEELSPNFSIPAVESALNHPHSVLAYKGGVLIADSWSNAVYRLENGYLKRFAGIPSRDEKWKVENAPYQDQGGYEGDGGEALKAKFNTPSGLSMCPNGDVLIADEFNFAVRKVDAKGYVSTIFGGKNGYAEDGSMSGYIHDVHCDASGFYVADVGHAIVVHVKH